MRIIHPIAGALALIIIATFWMATVSSELFGSLDAVAAVKTGIAWGLLLLVPSIALAGGTGFLLARGFRNALVAAKQKRMPLIAGNGLLILVPAALYLAWAANAGAFDSTFVTVQIAELIAGAVNVTLLSLNMRDGLRLTGRLKPVALSRRAA
ncbi:hypothetical protein [Methyloligella solikamskensis]|uniref:Transmembrane protein n=1 Tax=Methyloligella solikamskensis TaxID=1177756 RepID=A0ABW3JF57_9HYPH